MTEADEEAVIVWMNNVGRAQRRDFNKSAELKKLQRLSPFCTHLAIGSEGR